MGVIHVIAELKLAYAEWAKTHTGKVARDFFWSVLSASIIAGLVALGDVWSNGEINPKVVASAFVFGALTGAGKAILLKVGKYR